MTTPERFGPYLLLKKIGRGGMAELYLARQTGVAGFERLVAIKRILPHLTEDREFVQMFVNEAKLAAQITHPNVVQIYDFGAVLGTYYMAMEYVMGKSLAAVLAQGHKLGTPLPVSAAEHITARIASGLDHAYRGATASGSALGIIHRDISPQNILIGYNGDVKLVDFGIAKAASSSTHTQTGVLKGKLAYLSPEQAWGKTIDHRSDLFSLGIVLHEMLTGQRLFKAENEFTTLERVRTADVTPPSAVKSGLPPELDAIVLKSLAKNPDDRYPNGQAFEEALQEHLRRLSPPPGSRDLSEYLRVLFDKDIETDTAAYQQVTTVTKTSATPTTRRPATATAVEPTRAAPKPPPAPVQAPTPRRTGRYAVIGLGVAALAALTAVGAWSLTKPPTIEPTPAPIASATVPTEPAIAAPAVESMPDEPAAVAEPPVDAAPVEPMPGRSQTEPAEQTPKSVAPAPVKRPTRAPVAAPAKVPRRVAPAVTREATVTATNPAPPIAVAPTAKRQTVPAPKPVVQAQQNPVVQPVPARPTPPATAAPLPPKPAHEEAPLPLLP